MEQADEGGHAKNPMLELRIHRHTSCSLQTRKELECSYSNGKQRSTESWTY